MPEPKAEPKEWQELTALTGGEPLVVERVRLPGRDVSIEGAFVLPQLVRLSVEDQIFVAAFVKSHGSIKDMERVFGVSYPTIKARLNRIAGQLEFVDTDPSPLHGGAARGEILSRLERGEISAGEAIRQLEEP